MIGTECSQADCRHFCAAVQGALRHQSRIDGTIHQQSGRALNLHPFSSYFPESGVYVTTLTDWGGRLESTIIGKVIEVNKQKNGINWDLNFVEEFPAFARPCHSGPD